MSQQINLFNPAFEKKKQYLSALGMAQGLALILAAGIALGWYGARQVSELERQAAASKVVLDAREARRAKVAADFPPRQKDPAIERALVQAEADQAALREARQILDGGELGNTQGYAGYFRAFARARVNGLWLTGAGIVGAGSQIGLQGRATQAELVPLYIAALGKESLLKGSSFARLDIAQGQAQDAGAATPYYVEFDLQSLAAPADGAAGAAKP
ncbi:hypothetical protein [Janthinobacterium agaricidamnosum]|uniref:Putative mannose-sensitive agglutinin n=1 Tax=Janthinobacterium agaricidamnosum NBRC 102515 = DSM 9628 TaxID=1349767 RepID=W0V4E5_9BURK|nr:hypothetical protein [Janthinobacterium agaricidamnosum]CDG82756.1 putative mannose-sensitive agglutinin [Janthinobacterium agaricidamnosum NBRC 102515 = DSM 9628]